MISVLEKFKEVYLHRISIYSGIMKTHKQYDQLKIWNYTKNYTGVVGFVMCIILKN